MPRQQWFGRDENGAAVMYDYAAPSSASTPTPRISYEPPHPGEGIQWAVARGAAYLVTVLVVGFSLLLLWWVLNAVTVIIALALASGAFVALRTIGANHAHHLAYHATVIEQMQPQAVYDAPQIAAPPGPSPRQVHEAMLCRLVYRAFKEGDVTLIRSGDARVLTDASACGFAVAISKEQCADCYAEMQRMGILKQNASSGQWEIAPRMTYDQAMLKIDLAYPE